MQQRPLISQIRELFRKIYLILRPNWQEVSAVEPIAPPSQAGKANQIASPDEDNQIYPLIPQVREYCRKKILNQHSRMRFLSGEEIGVDQLYVDVWLLNCPEHRLYISYESLLKIFDVKNDRLALGKRVGDRTPGFEFANKKNKLVILGKPGSGKTTFLKHLAVDWYEGKFQSDLITVLIEFRRIQDKQWHLLDAIGEELGWNEGYQIRALKEQIKQSQRSISTSLEEKQQQKRQIEALQQQLNALPLQTLLTQGKLLILMDGLDEAPTKKLRSEVQQQLQELVKEYPDNRFILTCRTQIMDSPPDHFTWVEVADFNPEQVQQFVQNWFKASGESETVATQRREIIRNVVDNSPALKELTVTPVLLSLICLVLQDDGKIPSEDRNWLYQKGIKLLLSRWNKEKQIGGWELGSETYRRLSVEQKEELLMVIAAHKFGKPENFVLFEQDEIANQITQFLRLANSDEGVAVLKAIEAQHGLLIERADELWSFSHLTFQEYFTIQWLTRLSSEQLAEKIADPEWQQIVKQLVKSQQPANHLLRLIKQAIDRSIAHGSEIAQFLTWVSEEAESIQASYKCAAIRAFYFGLGCACGSVLAQVLDRSLDHDLQLAHAPHHIYTNPSSNMARSWNIINACKRVGKLDCNLALAHDWQFTEAQWEQLGRYYDANKFLADLMNIRGAVSDSVRAEIEGTLLLPWDELQRRRQPDVYGQLQSASFSPVKVFISYSREDEDLLKKLDTHLGNLKQQRKIQVWHTGAIEAGAEWDAAIRHELETAQIILLLISSNFFASDQCYNQQLQQALQQHGAGKTRVIPIILKPTHWEGSSFSHLSLLPTGGTPITSWDNRDEAFLNVVEGIRVAIESLAK